MFTSLFMLLKYYAIHNVNDWDLRGKMQQTTIILKVPASHFTPKILQGESVGQDCHVNMEKINKTLELHVGKTN